jgi:hypothetical protein
MPTRDDTLDDQRPKPSRRSLIIATIVVSIILVVVLLVTAEGVMRLVRPAPTRGSLVLDDELGWDRTPSVENPIPATAPTAPGAQPLRILFMGDSFTHSTPWPRLTIEELNRRGIAAMGWEAGVQGYGQVQESMKLARLLPTLKPDLVIVLFYAWNDPRDNFPAPGIAYNPDMLERPYLEPNGRVTALDTFGMKIRGAELFRRTALESWWWKRHMKASRSAMRDRGADGPAAANDRVITNYTDPLTWMPLYQPSAQEGAYMRGAWDATKRAFLRMKNLCEENGCLLLAVGIDAPFTIDRDVFDADVKSDARYRAEDFDTALPLRRFAETVRGVGIEPVLPAPALEAYAREIGGKIYSSGGLSAHLIGEGSAASGKDGTPHPQKVLAREVADAIERWRTNPPPSSAPSSAPSSSPTPSPTAPPVR